MHKQLNLLEYGTKAECSAGQPHLVLSEEATSPAVGETVPSPSSPAPVTDVAASAKPQHASKWRLDSDTKAAGRAGLAHARAALEAGRLALAEAKQVTPTERPLHPGRPSTLLPASDAAADETELPRAA